MHARNLIRNRSVSLRSVLAIAESVTASIYNYFAVTTQLPHRNNRITIWEKPSRGTIRRAIAIIMILMILCVFSFMPLRPCLASSMRYLCGNCVVTVKYNALEKKFGF